MSSLMDPCPTCGHLRRCVDRTNLGVTWFCVWCRTHADERFEPTSQDLLQREWERR